MMVLDLDQCELECQSVRSGDVPPIMELSRPFIDDDRGIFGFFKSRGSSYFPNNKLMAASESLICRGRFRESNTPLQKLIGSGDASKDLKEVALARAGQTALLHGLPMDLRPIISELGLSRRDLKAALMSMRRRREKRSPLPEMERHLLQSMLLDERSDQVESESLGREHVKGALDGYELALSLAADLEGEMGAYHQSRCMFHLGGFLLKRGEFLKGTEIIELARKKAEDGGFEVLLMEILKVTGFYREDLEEASELLEKGKGLAGKFGNISTEAEILFIKGNRSASESPEEEQNIDGIELMLQAARMMEEEEKQQEGAAYRTEAALWYARSGAPEKGIAQAKRAAGLFKNEKDRNSMIRALCVLFLCYMKLDERRRAKKLLLELVMNEPVKQFPASFGILKEAVSGVEWLRKDKATKELFEKEVIYTIDRVAVEEVIQRAKEAYPNEFGAMLRGIPHITHVEPVMEGAGNQNSFLFSLYSRFSQRSVEGEGVVHSHPSGSARPSRADLSMFGRFPGINIIIGYPYKDDSMAAYDRLGNRVRLEIVDARSGSKK